MASEWEHTGANARRVSTASLEIRTATLQPSADEGSVALLSGQPRVGHTQRAYHTPGRDWNSISWIWPTVGFQPSDAFSAVMRTATTCPSVFSKGSAFEGLFTSRMYGVIGFIGLPDDARV